MSFRLKRGNHILFLWIFTFIIVSFAGIAIFNNPTFIENALILTMDKFNSYLSGGQFTNNANLASGATRSFANQIAYNAFKSSPLFGVGIGTTRGYGIIPGFLANFGLVGVISYIYFIKCSFNIRIYKSNFILLLIVIAYFSTILSVWYIYFPALIPIYSAFSKYNEIEQKNINKKYINYKITYAKSI